MFEIHHSHKGSVDAHVNICVCYWGGNKTFIFSTNQRPRNYFCHNSFLSQTNKQTSKQTNKATYRSPADLRISKWQKLRRGSAQCHDLKCYETSWGWAGPRHVSELCWQPARPHNVNYSYSETFSDISDIFYWVCQIKWIELVPENVKVMECWPC